MGSMATLMVVNAMQTILDRRKIACTHVRCAHPACMWTSRINGLQVVYTLIATTRSTSVS